MSKLQTQEAWGLHPSYPETSFSSPHRSFHLLSSHQVNLRPDKNGAPHLRGQCSALLGDSQVQRRWLGRFLTLFVEEVIYLRLWGTGEETKVMDPQRQTRLFARQCVHYSLM